MRPARNPSPLPSAAERTLSWRPAAGLHTSAGTHVACATNRDRSWASGSRRAHFVLLPRDADAAPPPDAPPPDARRRDAVVEGLMPGYSGFVPHMRSNAIPGYSFHRLTRDRGAVARLDRQALHYMPEGRSASGDMMMM